MTTQTTKVRNGNITLPEKIRKSWKGADILLQISDDNIFIKKLQIPSFFDMLKEFRRIGKKFSKKDVEDAIKYARNKK